VATHSDILVYEPRVEGHHPGWLAFIVSDLLSAGARLSLAVDLRPSSAAILRNHLGHLWDEVRLFDARGGQSGSTRQSKWKSMKRCFAASGSSRVFLCAFDEIASDLFRWRAFGLNPLAGFSGIIGGIYHRPRFLDAPCLAPARILKMRGLDRLLRDDFFAQLLMLDKSLLEGLRHTYPKAPLFFLPDPCPDGFSGDRAEARKKLGLAADRKVLLFFGVGSPRKGLRVAVDAMLSLPAESGFLLLVAGRQQLKGALKHRLDMLVGRGSAQVLDRYVSSDEEKWCFESADAILLPYIDHFGTSGVLSRAASAGRFIIASDEQLVGRLVREYGLGSVFKSGDAKALAEAIIAFGRHDEVPLLGYRDRAAEYARKYSRSAFREAVFRSLGLGVPRSV